jgi:hypothetical protein
MEPANEPIPSDRPEAGARAGSSRMHGGVQVTARSLSQDQGPAVVEARLRPIALLDAAACLATALDRGVTVLVKPDGDAVAVDDRTLAAWCRNRSFRATVAVRILCEDAASVEPADLRAIADSVRRGSCPLEADVRAAWSLQAVTGGVDLRATDASAALPLVAETIARYAAQQLEEPRADIAPPDPETLGRLLSISGNLLIRPVETQVWAGFLEIGLCVEPEGPERPCGTTLLYDRPSGTWHTEP